MMGVPESQYDFVYAKTNTILGVSDPEYVPDAENIVDGGAAGGRRAGRR